MPNISSMKSENPEEDFHASGSSFGSSIASFSRRMSSSFKSFRKGKNGFEDFEDDDEKAEEFTLAGSSLSSTLPASPPRSPKEKASKKKLPSITLDDSEHDDKSFADDSTGWGIAEGKVISIVGTEWKRSPSSPRSHLELAMTLTDKGESKPEDQLECAISPRPFRNNASRKENGEKKKLTLSPLFEGRPASIETSTMSDSGLPDRRNASTHSARSERSKGPDDSFRNLEDVHDGEEGLGASVAFMEAQDSLRDWNHSQSFELACSQSSVRSRRSKPRRGILQEKEMRTLYLSQRSLTSVVSCDSLDGEGSSHVATPRSRKSRKTRVWHSKEQSSPIVGSDEEFDIAEFIESLPEEVAGAFDARMRGRGETSSSKSVRWAESNTVLE